MAKPVLPAVSNVARAASDVAPVAMKPSPKKETARIQIPNQPTELPKATVKLQQTQLLSNPGATASLKPAISSVTITPTSDGLSLPLSIAAFVFALIAFGVQLWIYL